MQKFFLEETYAGPGCRQHRKIPLKAA
jgi:hypothetical protein